MTFLISIILGTATIVLSGVNLFHIFKTRKKPEKVDRLQLALNRLEPTEIPTKLGTVILPSGPIPFQDNFGRIVSALVNLTTENSTYAEVEEALDHILQARFCQPCKKRYYTFGEEPVCGEESPEVAFCSEDCREYSEEPGFFGSQNTPKKEIN